MPTPHGALHRALADLTIGVVRSTRARDQRDREMGLTEILQQFQVEFSGTASNAWGFAGVALPFEFPFYYAPGQRDPDFARPQFWFGAVVNPAIAVVGSVASFTEDPGNGAVIAANVRVGVCAALPATDYTGVAHFTFQGFSALAEAETEING